MEAARSRRGRAIVTLAFAVLGIAALLPSPAAGQKVSVAAASDLKFALDEIASAFRAERPGTEVTLSFGSSGSFFSQISNGAPFEIFLSANADYARRLAKDGLSLDGEVFVYALGRIALWVPRDSPIDVASLGMLALVHPSVRHIAIANPAHAPYGRAAEAAMRAAGVYDKIRENLVLGENVAQAVQFVDSGSAEIGVIALSLTVAPEVRSRGRAFEVPATAYPRMEQAGVLLKGARDAAAARAFKTFLVGPRGRAILKAHGFFVPEG